MSDCCSFVVTSAFPAKLTLVEETFNKRGDVLVAIQSTDAVVDFCMSLRSQKDIQGCAKLFRTAVAEFGIDTFACGELDINNKALNIFYIIEWPQDWREFYVKSGMLERDPIVEGLRNHDHPFTWGDLRSERKMDAGGREVLRLAGDYGWNDGLVVPVARGGGHFGLVSLVGRDLSLAGRARDYITLMSECLLSRVRLLLLNFDFPIPPAGLSPREVETVRLVALGLTDAEVAAKLGISKNTVHKHFESARKRLHAKSRANVAARGVALGIISLA